MNNPDPSQRGTIVDQPGVLSDILPDQSRNRVYVLRQDMNQLQVFDGNSLNLIATLRTATSPTMMAMTSDRHYLLVGHDDSQLITVYDLNALQPVAPVLMPGAISRAPSPSPMPRSWRWHAMRARQRHRAG